MKNKKKSKVEASTVIMATIVAGCFIAVFCLIGYAFFRMNYVKDYMRQLGVNLTGSIESYAQIDGNTYKLHQDNSNHIAKVCVIGTINMKRLKDQENGKEFVIVSFDKNNHEVKRKTTICELKSGKVMIKVENENGKKTVVLDDVKYFTLENTVLKNVGDGGNEIVDAIP